MSGTPAYPLKIFYDGSCSVCSKEMKIYRGKEHAGRLLFVDISDPGFDTVPYGITLDEFMHEMHAIDRENHIFRGVDAFRAIWQAFPASTRYGVLGTLIALPGVHLLARGAYWCFARLRKYLPSTRQACQDGACKIGGHGPRR